MRASCCASAARPALGLEQLAPLERAAGGAGQVAGELEVVVGEAVLVGEEDEHERALVGARRLDRDGQQRPVAALGGDAAPLLVEAVVVLEPRRGEHAPVARGRPQRPGRVAEPVLQELDEQAREVVQAVEPQVVVARHQHGGAAAAERVGGRLGERVEGLLARDRLAEHGGDPVEAALDPRLARALGEALGVPQRERGEVGERLQQPRVALGEAPLRVARADAEDAHHLARPAHRRDDRAAEALVAGVRDGVREARRSRRRAPGRPRAIARPARPRSAGNSKPTMPSSEPCTAAQRSTPALLVEQEAVDRLGAEQRRRPRPRAAAGPRPARARW